MTIALRFAANDCPMGPIFLTPRKAEDFPTADPQVNARRWDHMEFIDWAVAQAVGSTLATLRSVDPDRPIKVHAYAGSPWGWDTVARYGGYSHHTGSGAGWQWTEPKQYGSAMGLQDSSEPGSPMPTLTRVPRHLGKPDLHGQERPRLFHVPSRHQGGPGQAGLLRGEDLGDQAHGPGQRAELVRSPPSASSCDTATSSPAGNRGATAFRRPGAARWFRS